jgi:hypothetical protein
MCDAKRSQHAWDKSHEHLQAKLSLLTVTPIWPNDETAAAPDELCCADMAQRRSALIAHAHQNATQHGCVACMHSMTRGGQTHRMARQNEAKSTHDSAAHLLPFIHVMRAGFVVRMRHCTRSEGASTSQTRIAQFGANRNSARKYTEKGEKQTNNSE